MEKYILTRKRGMKNLRLRVKEDGNVYVSAPYGVAVSVIDEFVESRTDWIMQQREKLTESRVVSKTELKNDDVLTFLGEQYTVSAVNGEGEPYTEGSMLIVPLSEGLLEEKVLIFMAKECRRICTEATEFYLKKAGYSGAPVSLCFKLLKSKWGSYNRRTNTITFNLAMCKLSEKYIRYVAAHEVTHIFIHNHSADFYSFGETIYDGFLKTDRQLNKIRTSGIFS